MNTPTFRRFAVALTTAAALGALALAAPTRAAAQSAPVAPTAMDWRFDMGRTYTYNWQADITTEAARRDARGVTRRATTTTVKAQIDVTALSLMDDGRTMHQLQLRNVTIQNPDAPSDPSVTGATGTTGLAAGMSDIDIDSGMSVTAAGVDASDAVKQPGLLAIAMGRKPCCAVLLPDDVTAQSTAEARNLLRGAMSHFMVSLQPAAAYDAAEADVTGEYTAHYTTRQEDNMLTVARTRGPKDYRPIVSPTANPGAGTPDFTSTTQARFDVARSLLVESVTTETFGTLSGQMPAGRGDATALGAAVTSRITLVETRDTDLATARQPRPVTNDLRGWGDLFAQSYGVPYAEASIVGEPVPGTIERPIPPPTAAGDLAAETKVDGEADGDAGIDSDGEAVVIRDGDAAVNGDNLVAIDLDSESILPATVSEDSAEGNGRESIQAVYTRSGSKWIGGGDIGAGISTKFTADSSLSPVQIESAVQVKVFSTTVNVAKATWESTRSGNTRAFKGTVTVMNSAAGSVNELVTACTNATKTQAMANKPFAIVNVSKTFSIVGVPLTLQANVNGNIKVTHAFTSYRCKLGRESLRGTLTPEAKATAIGSVFVQLWVVRAGATISATVLDSQWAADISEVSGSGPLFKFCTKADLTEKLVNGALSVWYQTKKWNGSWGTVHNWNLWSFSTPTQASTLLGYTCQP